MRFDPLLKRPRSTTWVPPTHKLMVYLQGGRIFTETLPFLGMAALAVVTGFVFFWWLGWWSVLFATYERWALILASVVHVAVLGVASVFVHVAWVRLRHLRRIPPGESAALRSLPILCRAAAELYLLFSIGLSLSIFAMPPESWPPASGPVGEPGSGAEPLLAGFFGWGLGTTALVAVGSILGVVVFYSLANLIETYQSIELNTRRTPAPNTSPDDLVRPVHR